MNFPPSITVVPVVIPTYVLFPDTTKIYVDNIATVGVATANVVVGLNNNTNAFTFAATDAGAAARMAQQIIDAKNGLTNGAILLNNASTSVWSSVTPSAINVGDSVGFHVAGTSLLVLNINRMVVTGPGGEALSVTLTVTDTTVDFSFGWLWPTPGVYELFYSNDGGTTLFDTALTITVT